MNIRFDCPQCERPARLQMPAPASWQCPGCDHAVTLPAPSVIEALETCAICGNPAGTPCDLQAATIENLTKAGVTVVAAAGNEGDLNQGANGPAYDTIDSTGYTPSAIAARFWDAAAYAATGSAESYDKQFVRDYLERTGWDKRPPAPELPPEVVAGTRARYLEAFRRVTGRALSAA